MNIGGFGKRKLDYNITMGNGDTYRGVTDDFELTLVAPVIAGKPVDGWATYTSGKICAHFTIDHNGVQIKAASRLNDEVLCEADGNLTRLVIYPKVGGVNDPL